MASGTMVETVVERRVSVDRVPYFVAGTVVVLSACLALLLFGDRIPPLATLVVLGLLSAFGTAALLGFVFGVVRVGGRSTAQAVAEAILRNDDAGVVVARRSGEIIFATKRYATLIGASGKGGSFLTPDLILDGDRDTGSALRRLGEAASRGDPATEEVRTDDGRWLRIETQPIALSESQQDLVAWRVEDVSGDRREQEAAFTAAQDAIAYLDAAPVGIGVVRADGVLVHLNATLARWLDLDLTSFQRTELRVADYLAGEGAMRLASASVGPDGAARVDLDLKRADGSVLPVRLLDVEREDGGHLLVAVERQNATGGADDGAAELRFNRFFFDAPVALAALDPSGTVTRANAAFARLVGDTATEGRRIVQLLAGAETTALEREIFTLGDGGEASAEGVDVALPAPADGGTRYLRFYLAPIDGGEGDETILVYSTDNTERRGIEAAYVQSQKMEAVGELAGGMAHDLNNMLTIIINCADELFGNHPAEDPSNAPLRSIKTAANQSAALVKHLLAYSRQQTMKPQVFDVSDVLSDADMLLRKFVKNGTFRVEPGSGLWPVKADPFHIGQVLSNLVKNADEAMPVDGKGSVTVAARNVASDEATAMPYRGLPADDYVMIEVTDTGHGMDAQTKARIFDPFFTTKAVNKGTGLGLAMVYGTVRQSNGFIFVDSEPGQGTRFRILFPRHETTAQDLEKAAAAAAAKAHRPKRDVTGSGIILLVEDETMLRATSYRGLKRQGYEVHEAVDGLDALDVLEELDGNVDLIVSDVVMPEMNGPTLLGEVRRIYGDRHAFMFVSGHAEDAFRADLPDDADFGFLPKPYELSVLATAVKDMLGK